MKSHAPIQFERLVALSNPRSSNADKVAKITAALEKAYPGKVVERAIGQTDVENVNLLKDTLKIGDILLVCGGDGTIGTVIEYLFDPAVPKELRQTPVLPVGTGRMNDVARMVNGRYADDPLYVLRKGRTVAVYPLVCTCVPLEGTGGAITRTVLYNVGFGYSGAGSEAMNDPAFRAKIQRLMPMTRTVEFFKIGATVLKDAPYFDITHRGKRRAVLEVIAANGHILGGYYRVPVRLSQKEFYFTISDDKSFLRTVRTVAELVTNRFKGGEAKTSASFILHDHVTAQFGGETFTPPTPCKVTIKHHEDPVILLATSPKA